LIYILKARDSIRTYVTGYVNPFRNTFENPYPKDRCEFIRLEQLGVKNFVLSKYR